MPEINDKASNKWAIQPTKNRPLGGAPEYAIKMTQNALEMADLSTQSDTRKNRGHWPRIYSKK